VPFILFMAHFIARNKEACAVYFISPTRTPPPPPHQDHESLLWSSENHTCLKFYCGTHRHNLQEGENAAPIFFYLRGFVLLPSS
jgi:hypothetical protein